MDNLVSWSSMSLITDLEKVLECHQAENSECDSQFVYKILLWHDPSSIRSPPTLILNLNSPFSYLKSFSANLNFPSLIPHPLYIVKSMGSSTQNVLKITEFLKNAYKYRLQLFPSLPYCFDYILISFSSREMGLYLRHAY